MLTGAFDSVRAEIQQLSGKVSGEIQSKIGFDSPNLV